MLEIIFLIWFGKKISSIVKEKGYKPARYRIMGVGFWFLGEIIGFVLGMILISRSENSSAILFVYLMAIFFAGLGAYTAYLITKNLPDLTSINAGMEVSDRNTKDDPGVKK
jgi:hypothetical protein